MTALPLGIVMLAQVGQSPEDVFVGLDPDKRFVLLMILIGCTTAVLISAIAVLSGAVNSVHRRRAEMDLKREMIERGMSADEIAKVIEAAAPHEDATKR